MQSEGTIRDTPLGACIGATIVDITADDPEEFLKDPANNRVYFHLSNGETIFATLGIAGTETSGFVGMLGTEDESNEENDG